MGFSLCGKLLGACSMEFKDIVEFMTLEHVLEGLGAIAGIGLLWGIFFGGGINSLIQVLMSFT